ncbi:hypothetical protein BJY26_000961 [Spelaeicoccus albus]|uniref:Uncharacterized protein n=1 Tax=Spelaeicoccus albus TaxID=1280376 RepID=A0A7Z0D1R7_9MICO|nr:hypothetical protein [Spelaeicoccus albus]
MTWLTRVNLYFLCPGNGPPPEPPLSLSPPPPHASSIMLRAGTPIPSRPALRIMRRREVSSGTVLVDSLLTESVMVIYSSIGSHNALTGDLDAAPCTSACSNFRVRLNVTGHTKVGKSVSLRNQIVIFCPPRIVVRLL